MTGPGHHATAPRNPIGERNFGLGSQSRILRPRDQRRRPQLRWFDHLLNGIDTTMLDEPPIKLFATGADVLRDEQEWPLARAVDTRWNLREGGGQRPLVCV